MADRPDPPDVKRKKAIKLRDAKIVTLWVRHNWTTAQIAEKFHLSVRRIEQIIYKNHDFVSHDREFERKKRIHNLKLLIAPRVSSEKDVVEIQAELRKELDPDKEKGQQVSDAKKIIIVYPPNYKRANGEDRVETISSSVSG